MKDAFGKILLDILKGKKTKCFIERDDGYISESSSEEYFYPYSKWGKGEKEAMKFVRGKVLDLGCGAGRHALYLQKKGFPVTAIDISPGAVKVSKLLGIKDVRKMDMNKLRFGRNEKFDTVLMMFNNFGLAGSMAGTKKLLKKLHKITSENAQIIASSLDYTATKNPVHLAYQKTKNKGQGLVVRIRVIHKKQKGDWFDLYAISPKEMPELLEGTGWKMSKNIPEFYFRKRSPSYVYVLKKVKNGKT